MHITQTPVTQFSRMVQPDGESLSLRAVNGDLIRIGYRPGKDPDCVDGVCILPHTKLQQLMAETLQR